MMYIRSMLLVVVAAILAASSAAPLVHNTEDHLSKRLEKLEKRMKALDSQMEDHHEENMADDQLGANETPADPPSGEFGMLDPVPMPSYLDGNAQPATGSCTQGTATEVCYTKKDKKQAKETNKPLDKGVSTCLLGGEPKDIKPCHYSSPYADHDGGTKPGLLGAPAPTYSLPDFPLPDEELNAFHDGIPGSTDSSPYADHDGGTKSGLLGAPAPTDSSPYADHDGGTKSGLLGAPAPMQGKRPPP